jgi:hypothetical protein
MNARLAILPVGLSLSSFLVVTYLICIAFGVVVPNVHMRQFLEAILPGFTWLTWTSFFIGLFWSVVYSWYTALVFVPLYNFFAGRSR